MKLELSNCEAKECNREWGCEEDVWSCDAGSRGRLNKIRLCGRAGS